MMTAQLELSLAAPQRSRRLCGSRAFRRVDRAQAAWWFHHMRLAVDRALDATAPAGRAARS